MMLYGSMVSAFFVVVFQLTPERKEGIAYGDMNAFIWGVGGGKMLAGDVELNSDIV